MLMLTIAAVAPALILLWYVYHKDTEPEPSRLIFKGFFYGGLSALLSTLISGPLLNMGFYTTEPSTWGEAIKIAFFGAAIPEETAKLLMLWLHGLSLFPFQFQQKGTGQRQDQDVALPCPPSCSV